MPPPLPAESDNESVADRETTPKATPKSTSKAKAAAEAEDTVMAEPGTKGEEEADEEEDSSDGDEEVYVVEKIIDHRSDFEDGEVRYLIKWKGYEKKQDRTWETEENLFGARELLEQYWRDVGGKPLPGAAKPKAKRKSLNAKRSKASLKEEDSESPAPKKQKRGRKSKVEDDGDTGEMLGYVEQGEDDWKPPPARDGAWDPLLQKVDTIEQDDNGKRYVYLVWNDKNADGRFYRSKVALGSVYKAAPQKMLFFYEQHLVFTNSKNAMKEISGEGLNGEEAEEL